MPWDYIIDNAVWSLGGLCVGYVLGKSERAIWNRKKKP